MSFKHRRYVRRSDQFLEIARNLFPPGGSLDGRPSFELFEQGPLEAMEDLCAWAFEEMSEPYPGIRSWITIGVPIFPPMVFYAVLDTSDVVDLIDLVLDTDYEWESAGDPQTDDEPF
jgi:hypothetical protein